jgi:hypothetical protein
VPLIGLYLPSVSQQPKVAQAKSAHLFFDLRARTRAEAPGRDGDHLNKIAYVSLSNRSNPKVIRRFANDFSYESVTFTSIGSDGQPIYHTNVMMCIGTAFALIGLEMIRNKAERQQVRARLERSAKDIVELSPDQIANFAGNAIELHDTHGEKLLVLSDRAIRALTDEQRARLTRYVRLVPLELPTIELGGGSARCMIATIHLAPRL